MIHGQMNEFYYTLPEDRIATAPLPQRDRCRLLALNRKTGEISHHIFSDLLDLLPKNSILVLNNAKVFPARLPLENAQGGCVELLLLKPLLDGEWLGLGKRLKEGMRLKSRTGFEIEIRGRMGEGWRLFSKDDFLDIALCDGEMPLPPYILKRRAGEGLPQTRREDFLDYQAVYAKTLGSVAAPTAGLHFTDTLLKRIAEKGIVIEELTLHVGWGTFAPIRSDRLEEHEMHEEVFHLDAQVARRLSAAREDGRPIVAVGTTSVRALESAWNGKGHGFKSGRGATSLFIRPPYRFQAVDQMITNFHLPMSSLLVMVSAFAGEEKMQAAYEEAIRLQYRFYSYGDAMWIY